MEIGEHCSYQPCSRLDFLPFTCHHCQRIFCKDHRSPDQHECKLAQSASQERSELSTDWSSFECSFEDCKRREMMEVRCPHCRGNFCLEHRHQVQHICSALTEHASPAHTASTRGKRAAAKVKGQSPRSWSAEKAAKLEPTKQKVLLMKLKMKAEGSDAIPVSERLYYRVQLPHEEGASKKPGGVRGGGGGGGGEVPMFFSREWSVGKVVDFVAHRHKLSNQNNDPHAKKRLVLCSAGREPVRMSSRLGSLLEEGLPNGGTLTLKYTPADC